MKNRIIQITPVPTKRRKSDTCPSKFNHLARSHPPKCQTCARAPVTSNGHAVALQPAIVAKGDPQKMITRVVPFESFCAEIEAAVFRPVTEKKSTAGRKPIDVMMMFRMLVLRSIYNYS